MPTGIDRLRKCIGQYYNDLQTSPLPKIVKRPGGPPLSTAGKAADYDKHRGYHQAMAHIFILALLSVQLQPVPALGRRPVALKAPRRAAPADTATSSQGATLNMGSALWRVRSLTPGLPGVARFRLPAATTSTTRDIDTPVPGPQALSHPAGPLSHAASASSVASPSSAASPLSATLPLGDEISLVPLPPAAPEKVPSEVKPAEPQPPAAPRNGAQALSLVVGPRDDGSPTVLPPLDNIGSAPSPTPPAEVGFAAQSFAGRDRHACIDVHAA